MTELYEAPELREVGSLHELTELRNKVFKTPTDFHYPHNLQFNFSS